MSGFSTRLHENKDSGCFTFPGSYIEVGTVKVVVVQSLTHIQLFVTQWTAAHQDSLFFTISLSLLKLISIGSMMPSNHLILCCPRLLPSIFPSIRVFCKQSALLIRWLKYWSFSFSISLSNEYSGLISFRIDWFDLAVHKDPQESSPTPHSEASVLWCSAFFMVQLSHLYMTTGKIIAVTIQSFVGSDVSAF